MKTAIQCSLCIAAITAIFVTPSLAETTQDEFAYWPTDLKINGTVITCSHGDIDPKIHEIFLEEAGGAKAKLVVIDFSDKPNPDFFESPKSEAESLKRFAPNDEEPDTLEAIRDSLAEATGVLLFSDSPLDQKETGWLKTHAPLLKSHIAGGGVVFAIGPVASHLGRHTGKTHGDGGLNLIPNARIRTSYDPDDARKKLLDTLRAYPLDVGIAIPDDTGIVLRGRKIRVYGKDKATFMIAANDHLPDRIEEFQASGTRGANPYRTIADLTAWRRDAIERQLPPFPTEKPPVPDVKNGTLVIVGGGGMPRGLMARMVEMAGGEKAKMVYVPCTEDEKVPADNRLIRQWNEMGVASAVVFHTKDRNQANSDEAFLAPLKDATGIWFGGGRQWNFADSYFGTKAHHLMKAVLERGGVIGGSSAGASIQADYLARANPVANFDIMAPGYERGLGFIEGVAIDQHFSQRGRQKDMKQLVDRYPQLLGIGIDEATALVVERSKAEIVGRGKVYFYDRSGEAPPKAPGYVALGEGSGFDLATRKTVQEGFSKTKSEAVDTAKY